MITVLRFGIAIGLCAAMATSTAAQVSATPDSASLAWARRLLQAMHAEQSLLKGLDGAMAQQRSSAGSQLPPGFFDSVAVRARRRAPEVIDSLVPVYARNLSVPDLKSLVQFYESPLGQRFSDAQAEVTLQSTQIAQRWGGRLALDLMKEMI